MIKNSLINSYLELELCEPLNKMVYMNETHNIMFWINILITVEPTLQYPNIYNSHEMLMMNSVCGGNKLKFTKK